MAIDFSKPVSGDNYLTLLAGLVSSYQELGKMLDGATVTNQPTGTKRLNSGVLEQWNGSSWVAQSINGINYSAGAVAIGSSSFVAAGTLNVRTPNAGYVAIEPTSSVTNQIATGLRLHGNLNEIDRYVGIFCFNGVANNVNSMTFWTTNTGVPNERMRLDFQGFLGIGTTAPTTRLQIGDGTVNGNNVLTFGKSAAAAESNLPTIFAGSNGGTAVDLFVRANSSSGRVYLGTVGTDRVVVDSSSISGATNNAISAGTSGLRWSNLYSVLGNFSGSISSDGTFNSGAVGSALTQNSSNSGGINGISITNAANTASSDARLLLTAAGAAGGDALVVFGVGGVGNWAVGSDNSVAGDPLTFSNSATLGTSNVLVLNGTGPEVPNGKGLYLPNGGGTQTALTWYREAALSFTPTITFGGASVGVTYSTQEGSYTRVGNLCFFKILVILSNKGSSTGQIRLAGLPFSTADYASITVHILNSTGLTGAVKGLTGLGGTFIELWQSSATGDGAAVTNANATNTSYFLATGWYYC